MDRFKSVRRLQVEVPDDNDGRGVGVEKAADSPTEEAEKDAAEESGLFNLKKVRRRAALAGNCRGDYIGVTSDPFLHRILSKQGDSTILFADKVIEFTGSGKMKQLVMLITDSAIYLVDPDADVLKRRISLAAIERMFLSKFRDNFFALIIPTEYDILMASTRKTEIANVLVLATKSGCDVLEVIFSNRFEYHAGAYVVKEIEFEEIEGGIKTRITNKGI